MASGTAVRHCLLRIKKDIKALLNYPPPGIFISVDERDIRVIHALIVGPKDTPYHGGFFYLILTAPPNYPIKPPDVQFMTTGEKEVMFHPHIYNSGRVCLSILQTLAGPTWSASLRLSSVLLSIQSLMSDKPLSSVFAGERENRWYNRTIEHETLRVAMCDMLEGRTADSSSMPQSLRNTMQRQFLELYNHYGSTAQSRLRLDGQVGYDPVCQINKGRFDYCSVLLRLQSIEERLEAKLGA